MSNRYELELLLFNDKDFIIFASRTINNYYTFYIDWFVSTLSLYLMKKMFFHQLTLEERLLNKYVEYMIIKLHKIRPLIENTIYSYHTKDIDYVLLGQLVKITTNEFNIIHIKENINEEGVIIESILSENSNSIFDNIKYEIRLDLSGKNYDKRIDTLNIFFKEHSKLKSLDLSSNELYGTQFFKIICNYLKTFMLLTSISFSNNKIKGDYSIKKISEFISKSISLTSIDLSYNNIGGDSAAKYIGNALTLNKTLKNFNISHNDLCSGCMGLINSLVNNTCLTHINLSYNNLTGHMIAKKITELVIKNINLIKLDISQNDRILGAICSYKLKNESVFIQSRLIIDDDIK